MASSPMGEFLHRLRAATVPADDGARSDGELLEAFIRRQDEGALAALVHRHGPMVWGVCRRTLSDYHAAEDAFQATFLVLARRADAVRPRAMVGNWLYGVAWQTARKARATAATRRAREVPSAVLPETSVEPPAPPDEALALLDDELQRLPPRFRGVLVLGDLEGRTRKEVARQLGVPEGTVAGWTARARRLLATRLTRRGVTLSAATGAALLLPEAAPAAVPRSLTGAAVRAATLFATQTATASGEIPGTVVALTEGVLKTMGIGKLKTLAVLTVLAGCVGLGAITLVHGFASGPQEGGAPKAPAAARPAGESAPGKAAGALQGTWQVTALEEGGQAQPAARFQDVDMKLVFEGDRLSILTSTPEGRVVGQRGITFTVDASASPQHINATLGDRKVLGIYAIEKGKMKLCLDLGGVDRPKGFKTAPGTEQRSYVLEKQGAPAK